MRGLNSKRKFLTPKSYTYTIINFHFYNIRYNLLVCALVVNKSRHENKNLKFFWRPTYFVYYFWFDLIRLSLFSAFVIKHIETKIKYYIFFFDLYYTLSFSVCCCPTNQKLIIELIIFNLQLITYKIYL